MRCVAVDWSGSLSGGGGQSWLAAVEGGELVELRGGLTRPAVIDVIAGRRSGGLHLAVGLDFGFSMPAWYVSSWGCASAPEFWEVVAVQGERWLVECPPPFWGRPGRRRDPSGGPAYRRTETAVEGHPKSVFQVGGAGAVGTGSIRGMPWLSHLRRRGIAVWPFDRPGDATVMEIYPRLLTGGGPKRQPGWRWAYLEAIGWPLDAGARAAVAASEDSFDAAVSALRMWQARAELGHLQRSNDPLERLEGRIWAPSTPRAPVSVRPWIRVDAGRRARPRGKSPGHVGQPRLDF